ncbi:MAG: hypothetical protein HY042_02990, partial [Spirochaetia bacterium]|nr:hypothetical protein [Spirochaetia bacterium]
MITYRYEQYRPDDENPWTTEKLMSILSELVMRHDMQLEEALRMLIDRGLPANVFLKRGGMDDLVKKFLAQLQEQVQSVLDTYEIDSALNQTINDLRSHKKSVDKKIKDDDVRRALDEAVESASVDALYRMKWGPGKKGSELGKDLDSLIRDIEDHDTISSGAKKYQFTGQSPLGRPEALVILQQLDEITKLTEALEDAMKSGDLFNFNLEKLARYLGQESYQEFLERREQIFDQLKELLEKQGRIVRDEETGEMKLSPSSIRKIGRRALEEIFSSMKSDTAGGSHEAHETGDSDNVSSRTRPLEFGDSLANMDISSSIVNAFIRTGQARPAFRDIEVFEPRGSARGAT